MYTIECSLSSIRFACIPYQRATYKDVLPSIVVSSSAATLSCLCHQRGEPLSFFWHHWLPILESTLLVNEYVSLPIERRKSRMASRVMVTLLWMRQAQLNFRFWIP